MFDFGRWKSLFRAFPVVFSNPQSNSNNCTEPPPIGNFSFHSVPSHYLGGFSASRNCVEMDFLGTFFDVSDGFLHFTSLYLTILLNPQLPSWKLAEEIESGHGVITQRLGLAGRDKYECNFWVYPFPQISFVRPPPPLPGMPSSRSLMTYILSRSESWHNAIKRNVYSSLSALGADWKTRIS